MNTNLYKLNIYSEICCDDCGEIIHNHFDCPVCKKEYAATDCYLPLYDMQEVVVMCGNCKAQFRVIGDGDPYDSHYERIR